MSDDTYEDDLYAENRLDDEGGGGGGSGGDIVVVGERYDSGVDWGFDNFSFFYVENPTSFFSPQEPTADGGGGDVIVVAETQNPNEIVADGVKFLSTIFKGAADALRQVPGVSPREIDRLDDLAGALDAIAKGLDAGEVTRETGKAAVKEALGFAIGELSDFTLSAMATYLSAEAMAALPPGPYKLFVPVIAGLATYFASQALEDSADAAAEVVTEALFGAIDLVEKGADILGISATGDQDGTVNAVYFELNDPGADPSTTPATYDAGTMYEYTFQEGQYEPYLYHGINPHEYVV